MNAAIHKKGSDEITYFVRDCVKRDNNFIGSNIKLIGIKPRHWSVVWTEEDVTGSDDSGWSKRVSELNHSDETAEVTKTDRAELARAVKIAKFLDSKTYEQVENYVNNNVSDPQTAKYLADLSKVVLALLKIVNVRD